MRAIGPAIGTLVFQLWNPRLPNCVLLHMSLFPASAVALDFLDLRFWRKRNQACDTKQSEFVNAVGQPLNVRGNPYTALFTETDTRYTKSYTLSVFLSRFQLLSTKFLTFFKPCCEIKFTLGFLQGDLFGSHNRAIVNLQLTFCAFYLEIFNQGLAFRLAHSSD